MNGAIDIRNKLSITWSTHSAASSSYFQTIKLLSIEADMSTFASLGHQQTENTQAVCPEYFIIH